MNQIEVIGFIAGSLVAVSLMPLLIKSYKTKSTKDIAISWNLINLAGQILWIYYGFKINSYSLVIMSGVTLVMTLILIKLKIKFG